MTEQKFTVQEILDFVITCHDRSRKGRDIRTTGHTTTLFNLIRELIEAQIREDSNSFPGL